MIIEKIIVWVSRYNKWSPNCSTLKIVVIISQKTLLLCPNHKTPTRPSLNIRVYSDVKPWNFGVHSDIKILNLRFSCKLRSSSENLLPMHDWKVYSSKFTHFTTTGNWTAPNASGEGELESLYISIIYSPFNLLWDGIIIIIGILAKTISKLSDQGYWLSPEMAAILATKWSRGMWFLYF